jgi:hypothetical protein
MAFDKQNRLNRAGKFMNQGGSDFWGALFSWFIALIGGVFRHLE